MTQFHLVAIIPEVMLVIIFGVVGVLGLVIALLNWFGVTPRQVAWIAKKFGRKYMELGGTKRYQLVYDTAMAVYLWGVSGYFWFLHIQDLELNGDVSIYTLIPASCSLILFTSFVLFKYFRGYYRD